MCQTKHFLDSYFLLIKELFSAPFLDKRVLCETAIRRPILAVASVIHGVQCAFSPFISGEKTPSDSIRVFLVDEAKPQVDQESRDWRWRAAQSRWMMGKLHQDLFKAEER
jgi:hypothetical protein